MQLTKRIERMRRSPRSAGSRELIWVFRRLGCTVTPGRGDHQVASHPLWRYPYPFPHPVEPLGVAYIVEALDLIDQILAERGGRQDASLA